MSRPPPAGSPPAARTVSVRGFVLRFLLVFAALELFVYFVLWEERWFAPYAAANARATAALLAPILAGTHASDGTLACPSFAIQVRPGCDAYQAAAVLLAGIAAFPASAGQKLLGAGLGLATLLALNLLRLGALLWTGAHRRELFDRMHLEILPLVFVVASLALLFAWASRVRPRA